MENKKIESLEIKLDGLIYQEIQEYCAKYSADETEFVNAVMIRFFKENKKIMIPCAKDTQKCLKSIWIFVMNLKVVKKT